MKMDFTNNKSNFWVLIIAILLTISISIAWFIFVPQFQKRKADFETYYNALVDAEDVKSDKISTGLTAIVKDNPMIQWQGDRLKVATFTNHKYEVGSTKTQSQEIWVTVVPELQNSCREYSQSGIELIPRIEQLLGLRLSHKKTRNIVEFWVSPNDLFRPTPDPEITDHEAQLDFPQAYTFLRVSERYKEWYYDNVDKFEQGLKEKNPAKMTQPWTRLGYTYDWGESSKSNHMGLSEFVLVKRGAMEVASVTEVNDYCRGDDLIANK